ncbi:GDP-mannose mannosyl hydrolase [Metapseudomonas boanensis]|uniref:GDP-mannose mannosyl hydrolase n=1 Tax=Metapseudomonas boanensis TaxID=2822138 RepID=A0ABS5XDQ5_9GAMM|nr:GDP-mannose mannosyl hydrolase [Pseudomonas boanensis]MBT8765787.1 GDP-mannose mannosyl hydrolase [Pseudomonas boanensis]
MWLSNESFRTVVALTPLVAIDLVVQNAEGAILLGQRLNRPAHGYWFVPGGRILKNESLDAAFRRLTLDELGQAFERRQARLLGVYEHFYSDSVFGDTPTHPDTHYVVLGYQLRLPPSTTLITPAAQHDCFRWWRVAEMQASSQVHDNARAYLDALQ